MLNKSKELKAQRGYVEPDSFVRLDGSEVLKGKDWKKRKKELWERAQGICEWYSNIAGRCLNEANDPHHIIKRWPERDDRLSNLLAVCRFHHELFDKRKPRWGT